MSAPAPEGSPKSSPPPPSAAPSSAPGSSPASAPASALAPAPLAASSSSSQLLKPAKPFTALVLGASGATGRVLVGKLANNPRVTRINAIVRRELPEDYFADVKLPANRGKIAQTVVDFDKLDDYAEAFRGYSAAFCCLGTTRAKAGSKEEFKRIDWGYITHAARLAKAGGIYHFALQSTTGADSKSMFNYLRVKGEIEEYIKSEVKFPSYSYFRPGVLLTERPGESRWGEWFAQKTLPLLHPLLPEKHCAVHTQTVAEAMMANAEHVLASVEKEHGGVEGAEAIEQSVGATKARCFENDEIRALKVARL